MLHNLLNLLQQPHLQQGEFTEIQKYDEGRRILEKTMREKGGIEYYLISKKFIKQWKYYVDYYEEMENQPREQRQKPDQINSDLVSDEKVLKYIPEDHVYNSTLRFLENEWDYEYVKKYVHFKVVKGVFQLFQEKYQSIPQQIRIGFYDENIKRKQTYANLARVKYIQNQFTIIYWSPKDNKLATTLAQVDQNSEVKSWAELLKITFAETLKPTQINNIRIWQPRHKKFQADMQIELIRKTKQIDGIILQDYTMIFQLKSQRDQCLILDFQLNDWQFTQLSPQQQLQYDVDLAYNRAILGCGRYICDFPICKLNNNYKELELENEDIHGVCQELIQNDEINWDLYCQQNQDQKRPPLQRKDIEGLKNLSLLFNQMNADTFGASFVENQQNVVNLENAEIDIDALKQIQDYFIKNKQEINRFISNLFLQKEKKFESLTNLYQLRAIFLLLQFRPCYETFLEEKQYILLKIIKRLDKKQKNQLAKWFKNCNNKELHESVKTCQKVIKQEIIRLSMKQVPFLEIDDASKLQCIFELLSIFYKTNKMNSRISPQDFIIENVPKLYKEDADKEEFSQFRYYTSKYWKNYSFTFCLYPWVIPIEFKNKLLSLDSRVKQQDSLRNYSRYELFLGQIPYLSLQVDRANIIESALTQLQKSNIPLKNPLKVQFIGEQGVDEGGPKREFFRLLMEKLITQDYGMFIPKNNNTVFWFNPKSFEMPIYYSLIGKLLGLALYNQVLLDVRFPTVIFKKLQGEKLTEEDLKELDMDTYSNFTFIREASDLDLQILAQTFNVTFSVWGEVYYEDLKPNGFSINVTQENKEEFIQLYVDWYFNKSVKSQFDLLYTGFKSVVDGDGIKLFTGEELQQLIIGLPNFDLKDLEAVTKYDGYEEKSEYIRYFWSYIHSLNQEMQKRFLFFCTGTDRIPVGGLKSIKFVIQKHGEDTEQLPSAHTCFNVLLLPQYKKKETLKEKFKISLENAEGFGLM